MVRITAIIPNVPKELHLQMMFREEVPTSQHNPEDPETQNEPFHETHIGDIRHTYKQQNAKSSFLRRTKCS